MPVLKLTEMALFEEWYAKLNSKSLNLYTLAVFLNPFLKLFILRLFPFLKLLLLLFVEKGDCVLICTTQIFLVASENILLFLQMSHAFFEPAFHIWYFCISQFFGKLQGGQLVLSLLIQIYFELFKFAIVDLAEFSSDKLVVFLLIFLLDFQQFVS